MKDIYVTTIFPYTTPIPDHIITRLRLLQYPNPEGLSAEEISWRDFSRFILKLMHEPGGVRRLEDIIVDEQLKRIRSGAKSFDDNEHNRQPV